MTVTMTDGGTEAPRSIRWAAAVTIVSLGAFIYNWVFYGDALFWLLTFGILWIVGQIIIFLIVYRREPCGTCFCFSIKLI